MGESKFLGGMWGGVTGSITRTLTFPRVLAEEKRRILGFCRWSLGGSVTRKTLKSTRIREGDPPYTRGPVGGL